MTGLPPGKDPSPTARVPGPWACATGRWSIAAFRRLAKQAGPPFMVGRSGSTRFRIYFLISIRGGLPHGAQTPPRLGDELRQDLIQTVGDGADVEPLENQQPAATAQALGDVRVLEERGSAIRELGRGFRDQDRVVRAEAETIHDER